MAEAIHKDPSHASRVLSGERGCTIAEFCILLELVGLKLVSQEKLCVSPQTFQFMKTTTQRALANEAISHALFEDPE